MLMLMLVCVLAESELLAADPWHIIQAVDSPEIDLHYRLTNRPGPWNAKPATCNLRARVNDPTK